MPEAVLNYLALLGWHPKDDTEILTLEEIIKDFSLERVQKSGAIFDEEKLRWFNRQYLLKLSDAELVERAGAFIPERLHTHTPLFRRLVPLLREKISTFGEIADMLGPKGELAFVNESADYSAQSLLWKKDPDAAKARAHLSEAKQLIEGVADDPFSVETLKAAIWPYAEANGKGDVLWPLRMALTGQEKSPDPFVSAYILGKEESLKRIDIALGKLS
jgi:glutamyl/glutaminyl-tRNA synthetase